GSPLKRLRASRCPWQKPCIAVTISAVRTGDWPKHLFDRGVRKRLWAMRDERLRSSRSCIFRKPWRRQKKCCASAKKRSRNSDNEPPNPFVRFGGRGVELNRLSPTPNFLSGQQCLRLLLLL